MPSNPAASGTGINPWWRYKEENVPGNEHLMVNVGTGNVLLQDDDMGIPHKGIALAFRRTYNSQSSAATTPNDFTNGQSLYGNGWTNTFDAHIVANGTQRSVFDVDGARYDYTAPNPMVAGSTATPLTPGQRATLTFDGSCGWIWTKKNGAVYYFYLTNPLNQCPTIGTLGGYSGKLRQIIGRNHNTSITFTYAWDNGDASVNGKIASIYAATESGQTATLRFADINGRRLLQTLTAPDNVTATSYNYDATGNLTSVFHPAFSSTGISSIQWYGYQAIGVDNVLQYTASPRWLAACTPYWNNCGSDGAYLWFGFAGSSSLSSTAISIQHFGVVNPPISDGTATALQSAYSQRAFTFLTEYFTSGVTTPTYRDTDGHALNWVVDGAGRPTQTQACTVSTSQGQQCAPPGQWLVTNQAWDTNNNLISETDPRGNTTDYAYDANGNTIAIGMPAPSQGSFRPTRLYSYDGFNNVTASCDESATHGISGGDWVTPPQPSDTLCPQSAPATVYAWRSPASGEEPFGQLTSVVSPRGYTQRFTYDTFGLLTDMVGDSVLQADGTIVAPHQTYGHDSNGNVTSSSNGIGISTITYDALGRATIATDPDGVSTYQSYNANGTLSLTETAQQHATHLGVILQYDPDGMLISETRHHGNVPGVTTRWYDGADRLVEVSLPTDPSDVAAYSWMTRYIYDLSADGSQGAPLTLNGTTLTARGGLAKTQQYLPSGVPTNFAGAPSWTDLRGSSSDSLGRRTASYEVAFGSVPRTSVTYDGRGYLGLASQIQNGAGQTTIPEYDALGRRTYEQYSGDAGLTPSRSLVYDTNGRLLSVTTADLGTQTFTYDAAGNKTSMAEPAGSLVDSPAVVTYQYNGDDTRKSMSVASAAFRNGTVTTAYSYRADRRETNEVYTDYAGTHGLAFTYSNGGRPLTRTDPLTGSMVSNTATGASVTMVAESLQYDAYGQVSGIILPRDGAPSTTVARNGTYANMTYDAENNLTSMTAFGYGRYVPLKEKFSYTARGESSAVTLNNVSDDSLYRSVETHSYFDGSEGTSKVDARTGQLVQQGTLALGRPGTLQLNFGYDAVGRVASATSQYTVDSGPAKSATYTRRYDAANRIRSQVVNAPSGWGFATAVDAQGNQTATYPAEVDYVYWPSGQLSREIYPATPPASQNPPTTYHWDGARLLFTSSSWNSSQTSAVVYVGAHIAYTYDYTKALTQTEVFDRDETGTAASGHWNWYGTALYGAWSGPEGKPVARAGSPYPPPSSAMDFTPFTCGDSCQMSAIPAVPRRTDGYETGVLTFQGVRTYDPVTAQWTTPDPFGGTANDPSTQRPFLWNGNNRFSNSDPSGYITFTKSSAPKPEPKDVPPDDMSSLYELLSLGGALDFGVMEAILSRFYLPPDPPAKVCVNVHGHDAMVGSVSLGVASLSYAVDKNGQRYFSGGLGFSKGPKVGASIEYMDVKKGQSFGDVFSGPSAFFSANAGVTKSVSTNDSGAVGGQGVGSPSLSIGVSVGSAALGPMVPPC